MYLMYRIVLRTQLKMVTVDNALHIQQTVLLDGIVVKILIHAVKIIAVHSHRI